MSEKEKIYLLWEIRDAELGLRGIFTDKLEAQKAKHGLEKWDERVNNIGRNYIIESCWLNHLFGFEDIKKNYIEG